ncbi:MAG: signal peptidase I [Candidatus Gribaldobacteria bacterium]|nr:signal peptidase I [Candidatus Gribaldobacteria bacterium]
MKIYNLVYNIFCVILIIVVLFLIVSVFPITGNFKVLVVQSGSMEPTIHTGSVVFVKPSNEYKIKDIVTFGTISKTQTPTTHRIVDIRVQASQPLYTTKGDANNAPDQKEITAKEIVGKVFLDIPYLGYAISFAKTKLGFVLIIVIPALAVILEESVKIKNELNKKKTENV